MDRKRIQCLSNASQHVPIYLQPFLRYSDISVASDWFLTVFVSKWAFFYHILLSPGYAPGTRLERGSNACKTPRCIYPSIFNRFWDIASLVENCPIFIPHLCLAAPRGLTQSEFCEDLDTHKTRMNRLSCGEEIMTIYSAVLIQYQRVTDGQTDGQTDVQPISITCFSIADARKNDVARGWNC